MSNFGSPPKDQSPHWRHPEFFTKPWHPLGLHINVRILFFNGFCHSYRNINELWSCLCEQTQDQWGSAMYRASSLPVVQPPLQVLVVQSFLGSPREENRDKVGCATRGFYSTCRSSVPKTTRGVKPYGKYRACISVKRPFCRSLTKQLWFYTSSLMVLAMQDICVPLTEHGKKREKNVSYNQPLGTTYVKLDGSFHSLDYKRYKHCETNA